MPIYPLSHHVKAPHWHPLNQKMGTLTSNLLTAAPPPAPVDLSAKFASFARTQGQDGSCTSFAGAFLSQYWHGSPMSSEFIWGVERNAEGDFGQNVGCSLEDDLAVLTDYGDCLLTTMPDALGNYSDAPTPVATAEAAIYKLFNPARVDYSNLANPNAVLAAGQPILIGIQVPDAVFEVKADGLLNDPGVYQASNGGHAILEVGWRADGRRVWYFGSWQGFGDSNKVYVDPAYAQKLLFDSLTANATVA